MKYVIVIMNWAAADHHRQSVLEVVSNRCVIIAACPLSSTYPCCPQRGLVPWNKTP